MTEAYVYRFNFGGAICTIVYDWLSYDGFWLDPDMKRVSHDDDTRQNYIPASQLIEIVRVIPRDH